MKQIKKISELRNMKRHIREDEAWTDQLRLSEHTRKRFHKWE